MKLTFKRHSINISKKCLFWTVCELVNIRCGWQHQTNRLSNEQNDNDRISRAHYKWHSRQVLNSTHEWVRRVCVWRIRRKSLLSRVRTRRRTAEKNRAKNYPSAAGRRTDRKVAWPTNGVGAAAAAADSVYMCCVRHRVRRTMRCEWYFNVRGADTSPGLRATRTRSLLIELIAVRTH